MHRAKNRQSTTARVSLPHRATVSRNFCLTFDGLKGILKTLFLKTAIKIANLKHTATEKLHPSLRQAYLSFCIVRFAESLYII